MQSGSSTYGHAASRLAPSPPSYTDIEYKAKRFLRRQHLQRRFFDLTRRKLPTDEKFYDYLPISSVREACPGFSDILIVRKRSTGKLYIDKKIWKTYNEIAVLAQISESGKEHNLNTMLEWIPGPIDCHIILEFCNGESLGDSLYRMLARKDSYHESFVWHVLVSCITAIDFLHRGPTDAAGPKYPNWNTICHLDIKPWNIFVEHIGEQYPRVVLGDFDCARSDLDVTNGRADITLGRSTGTPGWRTPEALAKGQWGTKTDVWQVGGVVQAMCLLQFFPYPGALGNGRPMTLLRYSPPLEEFGNGRPCGEKYSPELNSIVTDLMEPDPSCRSDAVDFMSRAEQGLQMTVPRGRSRTSVWY
jgi:serine/threonine protein kinase